MVSPTLQGGFLTTGPPGKEGPVVPFWLYGVPFVLLWCLESFCHLTCSGACEIYQRAGSALRK